MKSETGARIVISVLSREAVPHPVALDRYLADHGLEEVTSLGNPDILANHLLALFCSVRCPGDLILKTYDLARSLRDQGYAVVGGFHSPMEKECLRLLLRGAQPVVVCHARSLEGMRIPKDWRIALADGRMLLLSPFADKHRRVTAKLAAARNMFVATLAESVFIAYAEPGGKTEQFCREVVSSGKQVLTFESGENANLIALGARAIKSNDHCLLDNSALGGSDGH